MMLMTAVAWIYVVGLMALTEPSIVAGVMTFVLYWLDTCARAWPGPPFA